MVGIVHLRRCLKANSGITTHSSHTKYSDNIDKLQYTNVQILESSNYLY